MLSTARPCQLDLFGQWREHILPTAAALTSRDTVDYSRTSATMPADAAVRQRQSADPRLR